MKRLESGSAGLILTELINETGPSFSHTILSPITARGLPISQGTGHWYATHDAKKNRRENTISGMLEPTVNSFWNFENWLLDGW